MNNNNITENITLEIDAYSDFSDWGKLFIVLLVSILFWILCVIIFHFFRQYRKDKLITNKFSMTYKDEIDTDDMYLYLNERGAKELVEQRLSKLSGISCHKLRQVINYSLSNRVKNIILNKKNQSNHTIINNKNKNIYSFIPLKHKKSQSHKNINNSLDLDNEVSTENVIYSRRFKGIKPFSEISKNDNGY